MAIDVGIGGFACPQPTLVNLYGCEIGAGSKIAAFVEIQRGVVIGKNVKVEAFSFICTGVTIEDSAFIGPHVCFTNDKYPRSVGADGKVLTAADWKCFPTLVKKGASIGAGSTILCGITIGEGAMIGAGSVVTEDVPAGATVHGKRATKRRESIVFGSAFGKIVLRRGRKTERAFRDCEQLMVALRVLAEAQLPAPHSVTMAPAEFDRLAKMATV